MLRTRLPQEQNAGCHRRLLAQKRWRLGKVRIRRPGSAEGLSDFLDEPFGIVKKLGTPTGDTVGQICSAPLPKYSFAACALRNRLKIQG
jgi:hypothetical protein